MRLFAAAVVALLFCAGRVSATSTTSIYVGNFTIASQVTAAGGVTLNGVAAHHTGGVLVTSSLPQPQYGTLFFNNSIDATNARSFSAFFHVELDLTHCNAEFKKDFLICNDGAALILQNSPSGTSFIETGQQFAAGPGYHNPQNPPGADTPGSFTVPGVGMVVGFEPYWGTEVVDDGNGNDTQITNTGEEPTYGQYDRADISFHVLTWVEYNDDLKTIFVGSSFDRSRTAPDFSKTVSFDLFGSNSLQGQTQYYVGFGGSSDLFIHFGSQNGGSDNAAPQGARVVAVSFKACAHLPCPGLPGLLNQTVYTGDTLDTTTHRTVASSDELRSCRIYHASSHQSTVQTGYQVLDTSNEMYCCTKRGIGSSDCTVPTCQSPIVVSSAENPLLDTSTGLCFPQDSCYTFGTYNPVAEAVPFYNSNKPPISTAALATVSSQPVVYVQAISTGAVLPGYVVTPSGLRRGPTIQYGCPVRGVYEAGTCTFGCQNEIADPITNPYFHDSSQGFCYVNCIASQ